MGEIGYIIGYMSFFSFLVGILVGWYAKGRADDERRNHRSNDNRAELR